MIITVNNKIYILCYVEYLILFYDEIFIGTYTIFYDENLCNTIIAANVSE